MRSAALLAIIGVMMPVASAQGSPSPETGLHTMPLIEPTCDRGALKQGGLLMCVGATRNSIITMDGKPVAKADEQGRASIGLPTNAPATVSLVIPGPGGTVKQTLTIATRKDDVRNLTGLDCDKVDARTQAQKDHAGRSWVKKQNAFTTFNDGDAFFDGTIRPTDLVMSSPFGPTRNYTGVSKTSGETCNSTSVHRGYDMATPVGTPVKAPAAGMVTLADPDLYYEGGAVFLDHGQGLVTIVMHLSEVDVKAGDYVQAGDIIAKTGNSGRTTGPHLHWAVKWRNTARDDRDGDFYIDPALLLEMN